jgi:hypothetical protein
MADDFDFSDEVREPSMPTLLVAADADMAPLSHYVEVFALLGGGQRDGAGAATADRTAGTRSRSCPGSPTTTSSPRRCSPTWFWTSSTTERPDPPVRPREARALR